MAEELPFIVREASWSRDREALAAIRKKVFIEEQRVPAEMEWDGFDEGAMHALALDREEKPVGCGRLLPNGSIGRMAVLKDWRRRGVGSALLNALTSKARALELDRVYLHAQTYVKEFYQRHGFTRIGDEFVEAGIPHVTMIKRL
jgi:predicted GNAT family N-acyltransferase